MSSPSEPPATSVRQKKGPSRAVRSVRGIAVLLLLAVGLAGLNAYTTRRDVALATGKQDAGQKSFFIGAADRPDIEPFFKSLKPAQRSAMARNLAAHEDPKVVELTAKLLNTFDQDAREILADSLVQLAKKQPEATADQLKLGSSFQRLGVFRALDSLGESAIPIVVERLKVGDTRVNAGNYLLTKGLRVAPPVIEILKTSDDKDTRLVAADLLGKLRAQDAAAPLVQRYRTPVTKEEDKDEPFAYLAAIASIGNPSTEDVLQEAARDERVPPPFRAQVLLGLGRIGTDTAMDALWRYARTDDKLLRDAAFGGLRIIGDEALFVDSTPAERLTIASGLTSARAVAVIREALGQPDLLIEAASASRGIPGLVSELSRSLGKLSLGQQGAEAEAILDALSTTEEGKAAIQTLRMNPMIAALAERTPHR